MSTPFKAMNISFQMNDVSKLKDSHIEIDNSKTKCTNHQTIQENMADLDLIYLPHA